VDPRGEIAAVYRKIHMFDVTVGGRTYRESDIEQPGEEIVMSRTADGVPLGLSICYDCASRSSTGSWPCSARG